MNSNLIQAIQKTLNCSAEHIEDIRVTESFQQEVVWDGVVSVFKVDHPKTDTCYAWDHAIDGSTKHKYYAVLKLPPVNTPQDAIRAAIVQEYKQGKT